MAGIVITYRQEDATALAIALRDDLGRVFGDEQVFLDGHSSSSFCVPWVSCTSGPGVQPLPQDVIVSLDGKPIDSFFAMFCQSYAKAAGERLRLGVLRESKALSTEVVVGAPADRLDRLVEDLDPERNLIKRLNILGVSVDDKVSALLPDLRLPFGVVVLGRSQRSRAADVPIDAGDVIHAVNGRMVSTFEDLDAAMDALAARSPVALQIERGGRLMFVSFRLE